MSSKNEGSPLIDILVQPRSSRSSVVMQGEILKVYLKSPPVDGKANEECISLLAKTFRIPKSSVTISKGEHGKRKRVCIGGLTLDQIKAKLSGDLECGK